MSVWFKRPIPQILYHGSLYKNYKSIMKHGLRPGSSERANFADFADDVRGMVSLSDTELAARRFAVFSLTNLHHKLKKGEDDFVVFFIDSYRLRQDGTPIVPLRGKLSSDYGGHEYRAVGPVPPDAIVAVFRYHHVEGEFKRERVF